MGDIKEVGLGESTLIGKILKKVKVYIRDKSITKAKLDNALATEINEKALNTEFQTHAHNTEIHVTETDRVRWDSKQDALSFDSTPSANSTHPVTSKGIKTYVDSQDIVTKAAVLEVIGQGVSTGRVAFIEDAVTTTGTIEKVYDSQGSTSGVKIKVPSTYDRGSSEVSLTKGGGDGGTTEAKIRAGIVSIYAGEQAGISLTDPTINFDGNAATITGGDDIIVTAGAEGEGKSIRLNADNVYIKGLNLSTLLNNFNAIGNPVRDSDSNNPTLSEITNNFDILNSGYYYAEFNQDPEHLSEELQTSEHT